MTATTRPVRVALADGSPFSGDLLRGWLSAAGFNVVGVARDGRAAVDLVKSSRPDVLAVGLRLTGLDGLGVIEAVMAHSPTPVVLVCGGGRGATVAARRAVELGAVDVLYKRPGPAGPFPTVLADRLRMAAAVKVIRSLPAAPDSRPGPLTHPLVVIGALTGGPAAVCDLLRGLPIGFAGEAVVVQHLPGAFAADFAAQLGRRVAHPVRLAKADDGPRPGAVTVAPADRHLEFGPGGLCLTNGPKVHGFRPAIDVTMQSAARTAGALAIGVVLTGMGRDGTAGLTAIKTAGGRTYAQDPESCVVDGMPRAAVAAGAVDDVDSPARLAGRIARVLQARAGE